MQLRVLTVMPNSIERSIAWVLFLAKHHSDQMFDRAL